MHPEAASSQGLDVALQGLDLPVLFGILHKFAHTDEFERVFSYQVTKM